MTLSVAPPTPADLGLPVDLQQRFVFSGTQSQSATGAAVAESNVRAFGSTLGQQAIECVPDAALPGTCLVTIATAYGDVFPYTVMLQTDNRVLVPDSAAAYSGSAEADFRHTLTWVGADVLDPTSGTPLEGWTLRAVDEDIVLFSSAVPEPPAALLTVLGIGLLAWRRLRA
jgi:hypothetical protein